MNRVVPLGGLGVAMLACAIEPPVDVAQLALSGTDVAIEARPTYDVAGRSEAQISGEMSGSSGGGFVARVAVEAGGRTMLDSLRLTRARTRPEDPRVLVFTVRVLFGHDTYVYDVDCFLGAPVELVPDGAGGYTAPSGLAMRCEAVVASGASETVQRFDYTMQGVVVTHDPALGRFGLTARASGLNLVPDDGDESSLRVALDGTYTNVPPEPRISTAASGPNVDDGCPARPSDAWNGLSVLEATSPEGWRGGFRASTTDRDGLTASGDVEYESWWIDGAYAGQSHELAPQMLAIDRWHAVELIAQDYSGSSSAAEPCRFVVTDTTAPVITLVGDDERTLECDRDGGAAVGPETNAWLRTLDAYDPGGVSEPVVSLEPTEAGWPVDASTVLPLGDHDITVGVRDARNNVAYATRRVRVTDTQPPWLWLWLGPGESVLDESAASSFVTVHPLLLTGDACSPVSRWLYKVTTNDGADLSTLVRSADVGTDDTAIDLLPRLTGSGGERVYFITYVAVDAARNVRWETTQVRVRPDGAS